MARKCSRCLQSKGADEFHKQASTSDGLRSWCKECVRQDAKERRRNAAPTNRPFWDGEESRFMAKVGMVLDADACWEWSGYKMRTGYGQGQYGGTTRYAHRVSYAMFVGPIPDGLQIDHLCSNKSCVRPSHLEAVTQGENLLRGDTLPARNAAKTHCVNGHPFTRDNTYVNDGARRCRTCRRVS